MARLLGIWKCADNQTTLPFVLVVVGRSADDECVDRNAACSTPPYRRFASSLFLWSLVDLNKQYDNKMLSTVRTQFLRRVGTRLMSTEAAATTTVKLSFSLPHETIYENTSVASVIIPGM